MPEKAKRTRRVMVNFTEDEYEEMMAEILKVRRYRFSLSGFIKEAVVFYLAARENFRPQPSHNRTVPEEAHEDAPVAGYKPLLRVLPDDEE